MTAGMSSTIKLTDDTGAMVTVLLLTEEQAEHTDLVHVAGSDHLICTASDLFVKEQEIHLQSLDPDQQLEALPDLPLRGSSGRPDGLWTRYRFTQPEKHPSLTVKQTQQAKDRPAMALGPYVDWRKAAVPVVPPESAFQHAAGWELQWTNPDMSGLSDALLQIDYTGDIGRLKADGKLLDDNFYNGVPWQVGLRRFGREMWTKPMTLQLLPMPGIAPIYLDTAAAKRLTQARQNPAVIRAKILPVYESIAEPIAIERQ
jgi:hypothetical protein